MSWFTNFFGMNSNSSIGAKLSPIATPTKQDLKALWVATVTDDEIKDIFRSYLATLNEYQELYEKFSQKSVMTHLKLFCKKIAMVDRLALNSHEAQQFYSLLHEDLPSALNTLGTDMLNETFYPPVEFKETLENFMDSTIDSFPVVVGSRKKQTEGSDNLDRILDNLPITDHIRKRITEVFKLCEAAGLQSYDRGAVQDKFFVTQTYTTYLPEILRSYKGILTSQDKEIQTQADSILLKQLSILTAELQRIMDIHSNGHVKDMETYLDFLREKVAEPVENLFDEHISATLNR